MKNFLFVALIALLTSTTSRAVEPGYRGFVDYGFLYGTGDFSESTLNEISTTHGYQIFPQLFVGAGVSVHLYKFDGSGIRYNLPVFGDIRWDILQTKFSPFVDFKGGYSVAGEFTGGYVSPSVGCRMALGEKLGINLGVGYTYMKTGYAWTWRSYYSDINMTGVNIRLGLDF